jgi:hypothetical protein
MYNWWSMHESLVGFEIMRCIDQKKVFLNLTQSRSIYSQYGGPLFSTFKIVCKLFSHLHLYIHNLE